jgi:hypothetical protein
MARQLLNLPVNIPWKQIAVSPDMMDTQFCNKLFPFAWRSSLAISAYEPNPDDLPEELCGDRITYLKITASITGYQPSKEETEEVENMKGRLSDEFPNRPTEDIREAIDRITAEYFACYGVLLNVAVFPHPLTRKAFTERLRIKFAELEETKPGAVLDNPFVHDFGVTFEAPEEENNRIVDIFPEGGDGKGELDLHTKMVVTIPSQEGIEAVEVKVVHYSESGVTVEIFKGTESLGTQSTEPEQGQVHKLYIEGEGIDRVVLTAPDNQASLLEFAYFVGPGREVPVGLEDYPHIIALEPKTRDFYQAATESGEVLTASRSGVNTDKSLTQTESTESKSTFGVSVPIPKVGGTISGSTSRTNTAAEQEQYSVQTDASRERRETHGTTTQLSQMYNLLTGYHQGTNRAVFLMLPRPHILQPTDRRTFVHGLRVIEGIQEFMLIVARPKEINGLCVEAFLETGHFPEQVEEEEVPVQPRTKEEVWQMPTHFEPRPDRAADEYVEIYRTERQAPQRWIYDRREGGGSGVEVELNNSDLWFTVSGVDTIPPPDPPPGPISFTNFQFDKKLDDGRPNLEFKAILRTDASAEISVSVRPEPINVGKASVGSFIIDVPREPDRRHTRADLTLKSYYVEENPPESGTRVVTPVLVTARGLCACFKSGEQCPEVVPLPRQATLPPHFGGKDYIVDERVISIDPVLLANDVADQTRMPAMKDLLRKIEHVMTTSWRVPGRRAYGDVGFLESDYLKDQIKKLIPEERLETPIARVSGLPEAVASSLGERYTVAEALELDLASFARRTGLDIKEAAQIRQRLLGLSSGETQGGDSGNEMKY